MADTPSNLSLPRVAVVDDEDNIRELVSGWLTKAGYEVLPFSSTDEIFHAIDPENVECIVIDYYFPDSLGSTIHEWLKSTNSVTSVVFVSGRVTVTTAVEAIRMGAIDFLEKPMSRERLLEVVGRAVSTTRERRTARRNESKRTVRLSDLTDREREVCEQLASGATSKEIAQTLHISSRTVEHHRASLMRKAGVSNVAELMGLLSQHEHLKDDASKDPAPHKQTPREQSESKSEGRRPQAGA